MKDGILKRIKQILICLVIIGTVILGNMPDEVLAELPDTDFYSGKIVVKTEDLINLPEGGEILSENNGMYLVDYDSPSEAEKAYLSMEDNPDILASPEASFVVCNDEFVQQNVPRETENSLSYIEEEVPDYSGENVIALIDTGALPSEVMGVFSVLSDNGRDDNGHGSEMVKAIKQINDKANIVSIKALNKKGAGSISSVYSAIKLAIKMKVKVINLSIVAKSVDENEIIKDVIREALNENIVVIGAAGNSGDVVDNYIPGCINGVIIAGACDENGNRLLSSNFGDKVDWNIFADSTSEAAAKLSGFVANNCENDKTLSARLQEEVGKGLIFTKDNKENINDKIIERDEFSDIEWNDIDLNSLSKEDADLISNGREINSLKVSKDGEYIMLTTTDYAVPDDGTFVPAAWNYARITSQSLLRMNNTTAASGLRQDANRVTVQTNPGGNISSIGSLLEGYNYRIAGYTFVYEPGSFEQSAQVKSLGTVDVTPQSLKLRSKWEGGLYDRIVTSGEQTFHTDDLKAMLQLSFYPDDDTCLKYLYKSNIKLYLKGLSFNTAPVRASYRSNSHSIWYEEGAIGSAKTAEIATNGTAPYHAEVGLSLRRYRVYYQRSSNPNDLFLAGSGIVGAPFSFSSAEVSANREIANKSLGWNYGVFGSTTRPSDSLEIIPKKTTLTEVGTDGEVYYKYVVTPSGSNIPGKVKLKVAAKGNLAKVSGAKFKLMSGSTLVKDNLITNEAGEIAVNDLLWRESWDIQHDGNYVFVPVSVPAGYLLPREVPFTVQKEDVYAGRVLEVQRLLDIGERPVSLESVVNTEDAPYNVFNYTITGNDVSGVEHRYFCSSNDRYERMLPIGNYKVTVVGKTGYKRLNTEYLVGFGTGDVINLVNNERGSIRYIWEYNESEGDATGDVCINRFRK